MRAGHFVLEGVSGLVLAHGELQTIAFDKKKKKKLSLALLITILNFVQPSII